MSWWIVMKMSGLLPSLMTVLKPPSTTLLSCRCLRILATALLQHSDMLRDHLERQAIMTIFLQGHEQLSMRTLLFGSSGFNQADVMLEKPSRLSGYTADDGTSKIMG